MIPSAKEAKEQSEKNAAIRLQERKAAQLVCIEEVILEAIKEGNTFVSLPIDIYDETAEQLHNAGYLISKTYMNNSNYCRDTTISWDNA